MEFVVENEDDDVAKFYVKYNHLLPKIVMVSQGFFGETLEDTFDRYQIIRLERTSRQARVVAKIDQDPQNKLLSIPLTYQEMLCVANHSGKVGKEKLISTIVAKHEKCFPMKVHFPHDRIIHVANQSLSTNHIPALELIETFDEVYILGNFINEGLMSLEVVHVPLYLSQLRLSIVTGIKGQSKEKWLSYQETLTNVASSIKYDPEFGNKDIALYDPKAIHTGTLYSYVKPERYSSILQLVRRIPLYEDAFSTTYDVTKPQSSPNENIVTKSYKPLPVETMNSDLEQGGFEKTPEGNTQEIKAGSVFLRRPVCWKKDCTGDANICSVPKDSTSFPLPDASTTNQEASVKLEVFGNVLKICNTGDISKLNINQISECMKKLELDKYIQTFRDELIDGKMLLELNVDILIQDFGMRRGEALRLLTFAKEGHLST